MSDLTAIRPYERRDYDGVAALYAAAKPMGMSLPDSNNNDVCRIVAESESGQIIGYGAAAGGEISSLTLWVHPERQRQGLGRRLWECLRQDLARRGTVAVEPWVRQENTPGVAWLEKNGFSQIKLDGPVQILLAGADFVSFQSALDHAAAQGITITTLAEEKARDPECLTKLHRLYTTVEADVPGNDPAAVRPVEEFAAEWEQPGNLLFLAKDGEQYVGLSTAAPRDADSFFEERQDIFQQYLTGVRREYRQRGIATALKRQVIAHAHGQGYRTLWTNSDNPAMRALNWKLGFRTGPWLVFHKLIEEAVHA